MNILISTLKDELTSVQRLEKRYLIQLEELPKGSLVVRTIKKNKYAYLTYREVGKVKQKYLGKADANLLALIRGQIEKRNLLKDKLKSIREQKKILERALGEKSK